ncbi:tetratricopeptide repeat protein [Corynebacterium alimapuense]|uniref:Co-chaperone YbbN n=1 Tax=Corynebacterium alimapuense TaxID=1576874 RepID=A0A3M8K7C2_9CORY|nr:tetratricopeptide repeat protein [Corynebacterium alimapuense]RNE48388.1 co-chaperone YbbN [Corynebacterium alimapuense]
MTTPHRYVSGAIDLAEVKAKAEAREKAAAAPAGQSGIVAFFTVTPDNFESDVVHRSKQVPVVVLVGTSRSPASEQLRQDLEGLSAQGGLSFLVAYVDADVTPEIAQAFGIKGLPTVVALAGGQPVQQFEGAQPSDVLAQWVGALVEQVGPQLQGLSSESEQDEGAEEQPPADPRLEAALSAINAGDFDAAIATYDEILASQPGNSDIKQARDTAKLLKRLNPAGRTEDPVMAADADLGDVDKQLDAADAEVVAGTPEQAFDRLIASMTTAAGKEKARVRDRLLELFALFDAADPRVSAARTKMASALF